MIFLGAGASAEFDVPVIRQMTCDFTRENDRYKDKIETILACLKKLGFAPNIENILSFARGQANPKQALLNSSPFVSQFLMDQTCRKLGYDPSANALIRDIQEFIAEKCLVPGGYRVDPIVTFYSEFFDHLKSRFGIKGSLERRSATVDIFTTNYDNVIELYSDTKGVTVFNGYEPMADGTLRFAPELYDLYRKAGPIRLYKLHGSITFGLVENKATKQKTVIQSNQGLRVRDTYRKKWTITDRAMIYGYEKDPSQEPYFDLLYRLKDKLKTAGLAIVVGYSFSDKAILNIFKNVLNSRREDFKMIILNKEAWKIKRALFLNSRRIRTISCSFKKFRKI